MIKKKLISTAFLSLIFSTCFWLVRDIDAVIAADGKHGVSDLYRYYVHYNELTFANLLSIEWYKGRLFYGIFYFLKEMGFSFEIVLFFIIILYYFVFARLVEITLKTRKIYVTIVVFAILTLWLIPTTTVVLRQGLAVLLIAIFFSYLNGNGSSLLKLLIVLFIVNIHVTAIILLPLVLSLKFFKNNLAFLNGIFYITLMMYIADLWSVLSNQILFLLSDIGIFNEVLVVVTNSTYDTGFSVYKMAAFLLPILIYRFPLYFGYSHKDDAGVYVLFVYFSIIGMMLSGIPYHDRIFLYGWTFSPILIASMLTIVRKKNYEKILQINT